MLSLYLLPHPTTIPRRAAVGFGEGKAKGWEVTGRFTAAQEDTGVLSDAIFSNDNFGSVVSCIQSESSDFFYPPLDNFIFDKTEIKMVF